jgi:hypothetical protein
MTFALKEWPQTRTGKTNSQGGTIAADSRIWLASRNTGELVVVNFLP